MSSTTSNQPPNILVADDHAVVRRGLKLIIAEACAGAFVQEASRGQDVLDAVRRQDWTFIIIDINFPDKNGLDVLKDVKVLRPALPVLILSYHAEVQYAARAYRAGADGDLTKDSAPSEMHLAIRKVLEGGRYVSRSFAENLAGYLTGDISALPHETLSDREYLVLRLVAEGKTVSEIAGQLVLSVNTVSTYRSRLLSKLHLKTNAELMRYALDHGLVA
jgi:two-component system, NarL family, invasion response regulator UvrY